MLLISLSKKHGRARFFHTQNSTSDLRVSACYFWKEAVLQGSIHIQRCSQCYIFT
ncbi:hypothetical protein Gotur_014150 [Gossypium turneri]